MSTRWRTVAVKWGWCGLRADDRGLTECTLPLPGRQMAGAAVSDGGPESESDELLDEVADRLKAYFRGHRVRFEVPLSFEGMTDFGRRVLLACARIEYGTTRTYGEVAAAAGSSRGARAAGQALGHNPVPIVVPCHRVIGADGSLTGFGAGLEWKRRLLEMEGVDANRLK